MAAMKALLEEGMMNDVKQNEELFRSLLAHEKIKAVRSYGLWMAVEFDSFETNKKVIDACIVAGIMTDWFLFAANCLRVSPPILISEEQTKKLAILYCKPSILFNKLIPLSLQLLPLPPQYPSVMNSCQRNPHVFLYRQINHKITVTINNFG
jgi:hypothetical protein